MGSNPGVTAEPKLWTLQLAGNKRYPGARLFSPHFRAALWSALSLPDFHPSLPLGQAGA